MGALNNPPKQRWQMGAGQGNKSSSPSLWLGSRRMEYNNPINQPLEQASTPLGQQQLYHTYTHIHKSGRGNGDLIKMHHPRKEHGKRSL